MKNIGLTSTFLFTLVFSSASSAAQPLGPMQPVFELPGATQLSDPSYMQQLVEMFSSGSLPSLSKISNIAWAGRCFVKSDPDNPIAAGYYFRRARLVDAGPLASARYEARSYWCTDCAPDHYDSLDFEKIAGSFHTVKVGQSAIVLKLDDGSQSRLRTSGKYLIEELGSFGSDGAGPIAGKSELWGMCYYFIPEIEK